MAEIGAVFPTRATTNGAFGKGVALRRVPAVEAHEFVATHGAQRLACSAPRSGVRTKRLLYVEVAARTNESVVRFRPWKTFRDGALRTAARDALSARRRENGARLSEGLPASCVSKKSWIDLVAMPCIRESALVSEITPGSVVFPTYNAKADRNRGPQGRESGRAAC